MSDNDNKDTKVLIHELRVGRHKMQYKGRPYINPRIHFTGQTLQKAGFNIDDMCRVYYIAPGKIMIENTAPQPPRFNPSFDEDD